ncbi:MAG TPA: FecR family protein [Candidatus Binataceae bacterium]|nr:FecR family protein [Candidatus Binataceae bacterium]
MNRALLSLLSLALAAPLSRGLVFGQTRIGSVARVSGIAFLQRDGKQSAVVPTMAVETNDRFGTRAKSSLIIDFIDGTELQLGESSLITIEQRHASATGRRASLLMLWNGKLRSIVKAVLAGAGDFEVHTPNAVAAVRGTDFETAFVQGKPCPEDHTCMRYTTVGVSSGKVAVSNPSTPAASVLVTEGYETTVACESPPTSPAPLGMNEMGAPGYH